MNNAAHQIPTAETPDAPSEADRKKDEAIRTDHVSDPSLSDEPGHDWSGEGGATEQGPATGSDGVAAGP